MTLQQFEYIVAVDKYRHFGKAAEALNVTQPTLSLMIKKLEEELDVQIFDRNSHPVCATKLGRQVIDKAKVVIFNSGQIVEMTRSEKELSSGEVRIAVISTVAPVMTPGLFKYLGTNYPQVSPIIQEMLSENVISKLKKAEIDMGILVSPVNDPDLLEIPLYHEKFLAYVSEAHSLYNRESIDPYEMLSHDVWIMKDGVRKFDRSLLGPGESFKYDTMYEGGRAGTLIYIVNELGGITIVPELHRNMILFSMQKNLRPIVNPSISRTVSLVVRRDYVHEKMLNIVIDGVRSSIPAENLEDMVRRGWITL